MSTSQPVRAAIYVRISKAPDGSTLGIDRQAPECHAFAEDHGWTVHPELYVDNNRSAFKEEVERENFERLLADIRAGKIQAIVTWQADRLLRTVPDATAIIEIAKKHGVMVANVGGTIDLMTADGRKRFYDSAVAAQYESELKSERLQAKHAELRAAGKWRGGLRPFGYLLEEYIVRTAKGREVKTRLVLNPTEVDLIREAASRILMGGSLSGIVRDWAARKPPVRGSRGGRLNTQRVRQILTGPNIAGLRQNGADADGNPVFVEAEWPAVLEDRAQWETLRGKLAEVPRKRGPQAPRLYLLATDLLVCACGGRMVPHPRPGRRGYQCSSQLGGCGKLRRTAVPLEDHIRDMALKALASEETRAELVEQLGDPDATARAQTLVAQREAERARLADLRERLGDGRIDPDDFAIAKQVITTRIAELDAAFRRTTDTSGTLLATLPSTFEALRAAWETWPLDIRRAVVKLVVRKVKIVGRLTPGTRFADDQVEIDWKV